MRLSLLPNVTKYVYLHKYNVKNVMVIVSDADLRNAAMQGADEFLNLVIQRIKDSVGNVIDSESMQKLNGCQNSLIAYGIFRDEIMEGGFIQLIQNGYGAYIFDNPFAKSMRLFGARLFSKLIYKAKKIYDANRNDLEKDCSDDDFMAMYEKYEAFDDLEEDFIFHEEEIVQCLATYVDNNINQFIDKIV